MYLKSGCKQATLQSYCTMTKLTPQKINKQINKNRKKNETTPEQLNNP